MGVSALRVAACAGVLVGGLILGDSAAGLALADPDEGGQVLRDQVFSKGVNNDRDGRKQGTHRVWGEVRERIRDEAQNPSQAKFGSKEESGLGASERNLATFAEVAEEPAPEVVPDIERGSESGGTDGGAGTEGADPGNGSDAGGTDFGSVEPTGGVAPENSGSDYVDGTVASDAAEPETNTTGFIAHPVPYYLLETGGDWWNVDRIILRLGEALSAYLMPAPPEPEPQPEPMPAPAFRGGAPEPEPVLDASGGVVSGGSDYQATGFGGAPVLSAPIVAVPVLPPAAARFPSFPPAATPVPGIGSAAARAAVAEPGSAAPGVRTAGPQEQAGGGTVKAMSGQTPRRGYTDYLRSPGLPQLAGAALPGVAGILVMTLGGGVIGYRQASAGRMIRASGAARYLP